MKPYLLNATILLGLALSLNACSDSAQFKESSAPSGALDSKDPNKNPDGTTKTTPGTDQPDSMDPSATGTPSGEPGMDPTVDENGNPISGSNPSAGNDPTADPGAGNGNGPGAGTETGGSKDPVAAKPGTGGNTSPGSTTVPGNDKTIAAQKLRETCQQGVKKSIKQSIRFPERQGCGFGTNGNLEKVDAHLQAMEMQSASLSLPAQAQLCGLEIGSKATTIQYDDFMILTLNNYVLLSSNQKLLNGLQDGGNGAMSWDFNAIKGVEVDFNSPQYCLGMASSICQVPVTDTPGQFQFQIDPNSLELLADKIVGQRLLNFGLISTGDNDDKDCWHTEFTLDFTLNYVE